MVNQNFNQVFSFLCGQYKKRIAYTCENLHVSYERLLYQSNGFINQLQLKGVKPGDAVLFFSDHPLSIVIGFISCLRAGFTCIPLDLEMDPNKVISTVTQTGAKHMIVSKQTVRQIKYLENQHITLLEMEEVIELRTSYEGVSLNEKAFIFFTSGSTGIPKGVVTSVQGLLKYMKYTKKRFAFNQDDTFFCHAAFHTDMCLFALFTSLMTGSKCVLIPPAMRWKAEYLKLQIKNQGVSVCHLVPSAFRLLTASQKKIGWGNSVRLLFSTAEPFPIRAIEQIKGAFPNASLTNIYGSTETNDSFAYTICVGCLGLEEVPIGTPYEYVSPLILKSDFVPCKDGEIGELFINSDTNLINYFQQTKENTFTYMDAEGCLYFQTGDLVYKKGDIYYYVGRKHNKVKISGYNVSMTEVEEVLLSYRSIKEAAVIAEDLDGAKRLTAFLFTEGNVSTFDLRAHCAEKLPRYSIPTRYIFSSRTLPKTSSGKLDRLRLARQVSEEMMT
ncbi:AMP-binding protein [Bacillus subtilis]|uniref:AMP-binding protein n=1 Tax=Bacillus subtilis TaxID=1423 RepID=UPI0022DFB6F4|nr:AMP-binding protein [Bacillus subtilis]